MQRRTFSHSMILWSGLLAAAGPLAADTSTGPDPYAAGYGFTTPELADWGGWQRGDAGTLYAEWDVFDDKSHGEATDRSAAPDLGSAGLSSAWLGWNAGTFVTGSGNLYSFSVPEAFALELAGTLPAAPVRVALQVETQGHVLNPDRFTLNGAAPNRNERTYRDEAYPSPMGPTDLVHRLLVWELPAPPDRFAFSFAFASDEPHLSLTQVAVDIGSVESTETPAEPDPGADRTVRIGLPAEALDGEFAMHIHEQYPAWFPASWSHRELVFIQQTDAAGQKLVSSLKGAIKALYYDETAGGTTNQVFADLYRPAAAGDVKIAECQLKGVKKRRWVKTEVNGQPQRLSIGRYRLDLKAVEFPQGTVRLRNRAGLCDVNLATDGVQPGVPALQDGDYAAFRRVGG